MKVISLYFILIVSFASCRQDQLPDGVLPKEKMTKLLWDILLADEMTNLKLQSADSAFKQIPYRIDLYNKIVSLHKTTLSEFQKSFAYYQNRPDQMKVILDSLRSFSLRAMYVPPPKPVE